MIQTDPAQLATFLHLAIEETNLSLEEHNWLWQNVQYEKIPFKKSVWYRKPGSKWIAYIAKGLVKKCVIQEKTGEEVILDFYEENQFVLHLEDTSPNESIYYTTLEPTEILLWQIDYFHEMKDKTPRAAQWLLERTQEYAARQEKRIQILLLPTQERYLHFHTNSPKLVSKLSVRDTIAYLGVSRALFFRLRQLHAKNLKKQE